MTRSGVRTGRPALLGGEGGMATGEAVLLTPLALVVLGFLVVAGRLSTVSADVTAAARDAARAASLAQSYPAAVDAANAIASATLGAQEITCRPLRVTLGDPALFTPGGEVSVSVSCQVALGDVAVPGIPGTRAVGATSVEVIDRFRSTG